MGDDMETISIWASSDIADDLDEMAERWENHSDTKVKRSVTGREALFLGIAVLEMMERNWGTRRAATMNVHEKRSAAVQGMVEYFNESDSDDGAGSDS